MTHAESVSFESVQQEEATLELLPSGQQFEISWKGQQAMIVEVGGGIRSYVVGDRAVLDPYAPDAMCDGARGAPLIPWPNRLADGRYGFEGENYQVALSEPEKHNAIHGLLRWQPWHALRHARTQVAMATTLFPTPGYPFHLEIEIDYRLDDEGLTVTTTATNVGGRPCPFGAGQHPYLSPGSGLIDECTLTLSAATRILTDEQRQLPVGREGVEGTAYDFREPRLLGPQKLDFPFTDLSRDADGRAWARLRGTDGHSAELWTDERYSIIELYTGDTLAPDRQRRGLGAEPMSCPPNAFQSGESLVRIEPGQSHTMSWGARLR